MIGLLMRLPTSVTRRLDYFSIFGHLHQLKLAQQCYQFAKVALAFCQIRNKLPKIHQRPKNFCQSGKISPNLVTLKTTYLPNQSTLIEIHLSCKITTHLPRAVVVTQLVE